MAGYLGQKPAVNGIYTVDEFTSSGGTTYTLSRAPGNKNNMQVSAGGLVQYPSAYSVSGTTLTLSGVPSGQKVVVRHMGETILYPALDDDIVTSAKIAAGAVGTTDIATGGVDTGNLAADSVDGTKIADNAIDSEHYTDGSIDNIHTNFLPGTTFKGDGSSARGKITLNCEMNTHGVSIQSPAHSSAAAYTLTLPPNDGAADEFLKTDGSGVLSFGAPAGGGYIRLGGAAFSAATAVTVSPTGFDMDYAVSTGYDAYKLFVTNKNSASGSRYYVYVAENGGSSFNDSNPVYNYVGHGQEGTGSWDQSEYGVNAFWIGGTDVTTVNHADQLWHIEITMIKPLWAARSFTAHMQFTYYEGTNANGSMNGGYMGWTAHGMTGVDAISLSRNTGGNLTGYWTMYGLKS